MKRYGSSIFSLGSLLPGESETGSLGKELDGKRLPCKTWDLIKVWRNGPASLKINT